MIKHIVLWRTTATDAEGKAAAVRVITEQLEPLVGVVPGLRALTIHATLTDPPGTWDAVLLSEFATVEDLKAYQVHPAHVAAGSAARAVCSEVSVVDIEV